jgi:hypothetical protein
LKPAMYALSPSPLDFTRPSLYRKRLGDQISLGHAEMPPEMHL